MTSHNFERWSITTWAWIARHSGKEKTSEKKEPRVEEPSIFIEQKASRGDEAQRCALDWPALSQIWNYCSGQQPLSKARLTSDLERSTTAWLMRLPPARSPRDLTERNILVLAGEEADVTKSKLPCPLHSNEEIILSTASAGILLIWPFYFPSFVAINMQEKKGPAISIYLLLAFRYLRLNSFIKFE